MKEQQANIRPAQFEDAGTIFTLMKKFPDQLLPRPISDIVENIDRFLVCDLNGKFAGTVSWQILPEIGSQHRSSVEIKSLAVDTQAQDQGIGTLLVEKAIDHIRPLRPAQIVALTFTPEFFEKLGFKEVDKRDIMHKIYAGCINCPKYDSPFTCPEVAMALDFYP